MIIILLFLWANCLSEMIMETFEDLRSIVRTHRYTLFYTNALLKMLLAWPITKL